jgi:Ca-activated chloride channel homolog
MDTMKTLKIIISMCILSAGMTGVFADGFIVMPRPVPGIRSPYPLEVKYHKVDVVLNGLSAETNIDQEFFNPTNQRLEGFYIFPVPKNAVIRKFSMFIDGKETEAELLDAEKARTIYEDIVRKQLDPALLEYTDRSAFKVRIFPIEPRSSKRIKLKYTETLSREAGAVEYLYPLNTEKFSAKELSEVRISVTLKAGGEIKNIFSPTHEIKVNRTAKDSADIEYADKNVKPDEDFRLLYSSSDTDIGFFMRSYREAADDGFFFMDISPKVELSDNEIQPKDIAFILDTSGSMAGEKLDQAKKALSFCVKNLNDRDRFQIVRFSTEADALFDTALVADASNRKKAQNFIDGFKPVGGTNIEDAIRKALESIKKDSRPKVVVFITDGKPTIGETDDIKLADMIKKWNAGNARIFTFGIGSDVHTFLLDRITEQSRAYRTYYSQRDNLEEKIASFYKKIQSPVMTDVTVKVSNVKVNKIHPRSFPDLYAGTSLTIFGRYTGDGDAAVTVEGMINGKSKKFTYPCAFVKNSTDNDYIPPLWASRRVGYLLDQMRLSGESAELKDEVVQLARQYGIITPYTSFLVLEDETRRVERRVTNEDFTTVRRAAPAPAAEKEYRKDYFAMKSSSGDESIGASNSIQTLSQADNMAKQKARINSGGTTQSKSVQNMQIRNINGQAFYQSGSFWVDSRLAAMKSPKAVQVKFGTEEYFNLAAKDREVSQYMSLGKNVRFKYKNTIYEVID